MNDCNNEVKQTATFTQAPPFVCSCSVAIDGELLATAAQTGCCLFSLQLIQMLFSRRCMQQQQQQADGRTRRRATHPAGAPSVAAGHRLTVGRRRRRHPWVGHPPGVAVPERGRRSLPSAVIRAFICAI